jgi:hypothetical protein
LPAEVTEWLREHHRTEPLNMPKYVIEREMPGADHLTREQLHAINERSCGILKQLGPGIEWVHSYVTKDKLYCVYIAPSEELIRKHAEMGDFPANRISEITTVLDSSFFK